MSCSSTYVPIAPVRNDAMTWSERAIVGAVNHEPMTSEIVPSMRESSQTLVAPGIGSRAHCLALSDCIITIGSTPAVQRASLLMLDAAEVALLPSAALRLVPLLLLHGLSRAGAHISACAGDRLGARFDPRRINGMVPYAARSS